MDVRFEYLHAAENAPQRINDVAWRKVTGRHFVQHRSEENEILATDQRDLDVCSLRNRAIELLRRIQTRKSAAGNDYSGFFTGVHDRSRCRQSLPIRQAMREAVRAR